MANVKRALRFFCNRGRPEFSSFDSTANPSDPTQPGEISFRHSTAYLSDPTEPRQIWTSDVIDLAASIAIISPAYNIEKCHILKKSCALIASYLSLNYVIQRKGFEELHRVLQQVKGLLEGYSAGKAWSPLLLLKADNTEAFVRLTYDLRCAFACVHKSTVLPPYSLEARVFKACSRERLERASLLDRSSILTNLSHELQVDYSLQKYVRSYFQNFPYCEGLVLTLDPRDLTIQRKITDSWYAQIHEGIWCGQVRVVIKTYTACYRDLCQQEASVHAKLQHPNIVQFIGVAKDQDGNASSVVLELMSSATLQDEMDDRREKGRPFTSLEAINILIQIARGMFYVHSQGVMHRDLKPANILICSCRNCKCVGKMGALHVKIADFGDAKMASLGLGTPNVGTHPWMAPEVHSFNRRDPSPKAYTHQADVYSFGILCYEIVTGKLPFTGVGTKEYYKRIGAGERPELRGRCPEGLARLIKCCLVGEASERPDFYEICEVLHGLREVEMFHREPETFHEVAHTHRCHMRCYGTHVEVNGLCYDMPWYCMFAKVNPLCCDLPYYCTYAEGDLVDRSPKNRDCYLTSI